MAATTCTETDCENLANGARGLCRNHYQQFRRRGLLPPVTSPAARICEAEDCDQLIGRHGARGLCPKHYQRLTKGKMPGIVQPAATAPDDVRFWSKVDDSAGPGACWPWTAGIDRKTGYGHFWRDRKTYLAHRIAYELAIGPIPDGQHIDHVYEQGCRLRHCCNPSHLEAVTPTVNNQRIPITPVVSARRSAAGKKGAAALWASRATS